MIGARVYQPWVGDVNFPLNHSLYSGDLNVTSLQTREMLAKVDTLVVIGVPLFSPQFYLPEPLLTAKTKVIHIDDNPWEIGKNFPVSSGIEGDIKMAVSELISVLHNKMTSSTMKAARTRARAIGEEREKADKIFTAKALKERDNVLFRHRLMQELKDNLEPCARIVDDCWSYSSVLRRTFAFSEPKSYQRSRAGQHWLGFGGRWSEVGLA
jgi:benzoylformate decarboxylase